MIGEIETYVVALRRELREWAPADWQQQVRALVDEIVPIQASAERMQVVTDPESIARIRAALGGFLHIETLDPRFPSA
ncbi:MAG: hypothetical protein ABI639_05610 [Thermoanaerobaculia bacterium]